MNCREYITEFEERGNLSKTATLHLKICADCKKVSDRQTQVWLMIDGLKQVDAPNDFDFRVKARIAQAKPLDFKRPRFVPILRYVLPLSVIIVLCSLLVFNSVYFSGASEIAQKTIEVPNVAATLPANAAPVNQLAFTAPENQDKTAVTPPVINENPLIALTPKQSKNELSKLPEIAASVPNRLIKSPKPKFVKNSGGSNDLSTKASPIFLPKGINPNRTITTAPNAATPKSLNGEQLLSFFGIETAVEKGKKIVKSLSENNVGARSGVKVGDVIETVKQNSITVMRGAEKVEISLQK